MASEFCCEVVGEDAATPAARDSPTGFIADKVEPSGEPSSPRSDRAWCNACVYRLTVFFVIACGSQPVAPAAPTNAGSGSAPAPASALDPAKQLAGAAACRAAIDHAAAVSKVTDKEEVDELVGLCTQSWPRAATDCVLATPDEQGLDACDKLIPRPESHLTDEQRTKKMVQQIAYEAFPIWATVHPDESCPASLDEFEDVPAKDPWGKPFRTYCGSTLPPGVKGFGVVSAGPDQKFDTLDDIKSWE